MSALAKAIPEVAKFKPKEARDEFRVLIVKSLAKDLNLIARVRSEVNKAAGDGTKISVTEMLVEEAEALRDEQFKEWGGRPVDEAAEAHLIKRLVKEYRAEAEDAEDVSGRR